MTQKDTIKELQKENKLLRENIELRKELEQPNDLGDLITVDKPQLEVGKWYKNIKNCNLLVCYQGGMLGYGFDGIGIWGGSEGWDFQSKPQNWFLATDKEVEQALIKEFHKKYKNKKFDSLDRVHNKFNYENGFSKMMYVKERNSLYVAQDGVGGQDIFRDGKWAEIIKDKVPTINGYEMEVDSCGIVKFGCAKANKIRIKEFNAGGSKITQIYIEETHVKY